ncbi:uncharacterized protein LOC129755931 [Uranotaenia lowii]|uniref:uncharacterized protein LOC129755931 n=1 Tax=Uranotaenia lowii TaxID=190385 RepID=UPI00247B0F37|nr:uncharacterized protein LOC129755931 [Uranotaenia lowii]
MCKFNMDFQYYLLSFLLLNAATSLADDKAWNGKWFPNPPSGSTTQPNSTTSTVTTEKTTITTLGASASTPAASVQRVPMGIRDPDCDDAQHNLAIDFDPYDVRHSTVHMCLDHRRDYRGDYNMEPLITLQQVPAVYVAIHKCINTTIQYDERIPTFGTHRPLWPRYGEYKYVPPQRWLHTSEHGGIIALYHPCANKHQVEQFKAIVKSCLYRHVISASDLPSRDRPFAVVAWGALLEFSVLEREVVEDFIREHALRGPEQTARDGQYDHLLLEPAQIVSTLDDEVLCPKHRRRD